MLRVLVTFLILSAFSSVAAAEKRLAFLIGNEAYREQIGRLTNPHNDVALLGERLRQLGFEVTTVHDAGLAELQVAVNAYVRRVAAAGPDAVGFFYYSGHGAADGDTNYLIPVDVRSNLTEELWDQSLRLTEITHKLSSEAGKATHFVVFDACRNTLRLTKPGSRALLQAKGFVPTGQQGGMLIAYATAPGELASDQGDMGGPYARILAEEIVRPGVEAVTVFRTVQIRVKNAAGQDPWLSFPTLPPIYFAGSSAAKRRDGEQQPNENLGGHTTKRPAPIRLSIVDPDNANVQRHVLVAVRDDLPGAELVQDAKQEQADYQLRLTSTARNNLGRRCGWQREYVIDYQLFKILDKSVKTRGQVSGAACLAAVGDETDADIAAMREASHRLVSDLGEKLGLNHE